MTSSIAEFGVRTYGWTFVTIGMLTGLPEPALRQTGARFVAADFRDSKLLDLVRSLAA